MNFDLITMLRQVTAETLVGKTSKGNKSETMCKSIRGIFSESNIEQKKDKYTEKKDVKAPDSGLKWGVSGYWYNQLDSCISAGGSYFYHCVKRKIIPPIPRDTL